MGNKLLFILGVLLLGVSIFDVFLVYLNVDIPFSVLIIFFLFLALFFLFFEKVTIFKDREFIVYFLILLISIIFTTFISTNYNIEVIIFCTI